MSGQVRNEAVVFKICVVVMTTCCIRSDQSPMSVQSLSEEDLEARMYDQFLVDLEALQAIVAGPGVFVVVMSWDLGQMCFSPKTAPCFKKMWKLRKSLFFAFLCPAFFVPFSFFGCCLMFVLFYSFVVAEVICIYLLK